MGRQLKKKGCGTWKLHSERYLKDIKRPVKTTVLAHMMPHVIVHDIMDGGRSLAWWPASHVRVRMAAQVGNAATGAWCLGAVRDHAFVAGSSWLGCELRCLHKGA